MPLERISRWADRSAGRLFQEQVGPGTGGDQHTLCANVEACAGHAVPHAAAFDLAAALQEFFRRHIIGDRGAVGIGVHQILQSDALGRVHLGIVIFEGTLKTIGCQHRLACQRIFRRYPTMAGQVLGRIFQTVPVIRQKIIKRQSCLELGAFGNASVVERQKKGQRPHQMRRHAHQAQPFAQRFAHQRDFQVAQIAQSAMRQLGIVRAGGGGEVPHLDQRHLESRASPHRAR